MIRKRLTTALFLMTLLLAMMPLAARAEPAQSPPAQEGTNLLQNPGFEGLVCGPGSAEGWCDDNWTRNTHDGSVHDNIFTPQGWVTWWRKGEDFGQPEVKTIPKVDPFIGPPSRIRSGNYAAMFFTYYRNHDGGFYQVVTGLEPGATVEAFAHAHGWSCDEGGEPYTCGDEWNLTFQVGIEPNGVADPFSPNVVWSPEQKSPDKFRSIGPVSAQVGGDGSVTVILRSKTKWAMQHLDAYWDDASLVVTAPGAAPTDTPPPVPPTPTAGPSPTALPTSTPRPDKSIVHVVESGETLYGIALRYNVTPDQIRELNASSIGPNDLIRAGQELVISVSGEASTPTPLPEPPTATPETAAQATASPSPESDAASLCVLAFHDRNGDTVRDSEGEELLPNVDFTVADASGVVAEYTTDGVSEPYCFTGLPPGSYRVIQQAPAGYEPTGMTEQNVALAEGTSFDFQFGSVRAEATSPGEAGGEETEPASPGEESGDSGRDGPELGNILVNVARVAGILVLILAGAIAVLFVLTRRRRR
ncbi:MAG: LysM peptidoglycan-binding domain-containing protein [Anaerolineae bacterium]|jgi:LysM repeat protein